MTTVLALAMLVGLVMLRALAAAGEVMIAASGSGGRRGWLARDDVLASSARATAQVACGASVALVTALVWRRWGRGIVPLALALVVPVMLVIGDLVPRGLAAGAPERHRRLLEPMLSASAVLLAPLLLAERALASLLGPRALSTPLATLRRLGGWLAAQPRRGPLDVSEAGLGARIARFAGRSARDAMVPHVELCAVPDTASVGEVVALVHERGFSRLPVFHERLFNTIGIVSILDLLGEVDPGRAVTAVMRDPLFVPESKPLPELLATLQAEGRRLAVVVDEYGGAVGLVTVEDLVEEIVGEIEDEYDAPRELYRRVAPGVFVVSARAPVAEVNERFGWNLPHG
jgi:CBS domain containing-hemolysin-like protein